MTVRTDDPLDQLHSPAAASFTCAVQLGIGTGDRCNRSGQRLPVDYATPHALLPQPRSRAQQPKSVRVVAILGFWFSAIAIIHHSLSLSVLYVRGASGTLEGLAGLWPIVDSVCSVTLAIILLLSAYQTLRFKPVGRRAMIGWAVVFLIYLFIHVQVMFAVVIPARLPQMEEGLGLLNASASSPPAASLVYLIAVLTLGGIALYPIVVLVVLGRNAMRDRVGITPFA